jgi:hypothetical protein
MEGAHGLTSQRLASTPPPQATASRAVRLSRQSPRFMSRRAPRPARRFRSLDTLTSHRGRFHKDGSDEQLRNLGRGANRQVNGPTEQTWCVRRRGHPDMESGVTTCCCPCLARKLSQLSQFVTGRVFSASLKTLIAWSTAFAQFKRRVKSSREAALIAR